MPTNLITDDDWSFSNSAGLSGDPPTLQGAHVELPALNTFGGGGTDGLAEFDYAFRDGWTYEFGLWVLGDDALNDATHTSTLRVLFDGALLDTISESEITLGAWTSFGPYTGTGDGTTKTFRLETARTFSLDVFRHDWRADIVYAVGINGAVQTPDNGQDPYFTFKRWHVTAEGGVLRSEAETAKDYRGFLVDKLDYRQRDRDEIIASSSRSERPPEAP